MIRGIGAAVMLATIAGCALSDNSPEGAAKQFVRAVAMRDGPRMFEMLAPEAQTKLKKMAELATAQTSGRRRFKPEELLAAGLDQPRYRLSRVQVEKVSGDRATVALLSAHAKERESLELIKIDGHWRIRLPKGAMDRRMPARKAPAAAPTSAPASAPAGAPTSAPAGAPATKAP